MFVKAVHLLNFKSLKDCKVEFRSGFNCIIGENGIGKSNLIGTNIVAFIDWLKIKEHKKRIE